MNADDAETVEVDSLAEWVTAYRTAKDHAARWAETAEECKAKLVAHLDEHEAEVGTVDGQPAIKHTEVTSHRFDSKGFRRDHPELAAEYTTASTTRRFTVADR